MRTLTLDTSSDNPFIRTFSKQVEQFDHSSYGMMGLYLTFQSCLGGIACMFFLHSDDSIWLMLPCAIVTMMCNALLISQASNRWSVFLFDLSVIISTFYIIAYNL